MESRQALDNRPSWCFLPPLLLLAFGLYIVHIDQESLWRDEVDTIRFASEIWQELGESQPLPETARELGAYLTRPGWNGPLYFFVMELWLRAAGRSEFALRFPSALAAILVLCLVFALTRRLLGPLAGRQAALLAASNAYLAWYAGEAKMYTLITALALLSTLLLLKAAASGRQALWLAYVLVTSLLFYSHILTPLFLPIQALLVLLLTPRTVLSPAAIISAGMLTVPYLPLLRWQWPHLAQPAETGFPFVPLPNMVQRLAEVISRGVIGWPAAIPLILLLGAMGMALVLAMLRRQHPPPGEPLPPRGRLVVGLLLWAFLPIIELYLVSLRRPLFTERYLIWILPAWLILASSGLGQLAEWGKVGRLLKPAWSLALVLVGLVGIHHQWQTEVRADFRSATSFVSAHYQSDELIIFQIPYLQATFDYYAPDLDYRAAEGPYTNWGNPPEEVDQYLGLVTAGHPRVWLLLAEAPSWDARGLTLRWFQEHAIPLKTLSVNQVEVYQWQLQKPDHY